MKRIFILTILIVLIKDSTAVNYYWVGGTGKWSEHNNHWATTSGGSVFHIDVPSPSDDVYFDANSFSSGDSLRLDTTVLNCHSMIWSNTSYVFVYGTSGTKYLEIYGSVKLMNNIKCHQYFRLKSNGQDSLDFAGDTLGAVEFAGSGQWNLFSDFNVGLIYFDHGTFYSNGYNINASSTITGTGSTVHLSTSTINCNYWISTGFFIPNASQVTFNCKTFNCGQNQHFKKVVATLTFDMYNSSQCDSVFANRVHIRLNCHISYLEMQHNSLTHLEGETSTIHHLKMNSPSAEILGQLNVDSLIFRDSMYIDVSGATIQINEHLKVNGFCSKMAFLTGASSTGSFVNQSTSTNLNYVRFKNISVSGNVMLASNSIDEGNVTGITITSPVSRNFYWVNGTGKWNDNNHWSSSSGGSGELCVPTRYDSVFFDNNSFTGNDTVYTTGQIACKNMVWNTTYNPVFYEIYTPTNETRIYGSLILCQNMTWLNHAPLYFSVDTLNGHIDLAGHSTSYMYLEGTGEIILDDSLTLLGSSALTIHGGILRTNGHKITADTINLDLINTGIYSPYIYLDSSLIKCHYWNNWGFSIDGSLSTITCTNFYDNIQNPYWNLSCLTASHANCSFHDVDAGIIYGGGTFHHLKIIELPGGYYSSLTGPATIEKLTFNSPYTKTFYSIIADTLETIYNNTLLQFDTVHVNNLLNLIGGCSSIITVEEGYITFNGNYNINSVVMHNVTFAGTPVNAVSSIDNGGNSGINFVAPSARQLYWVNGTGEWNDVNHWSMTSGGPGGSCIPGVLDDIHFDSNSFLTNDDTVLVTSAFIFAHSMTWTDSAYFLDAIIFNSPIFNLQGSIYLYPGVKWIFNKMTTEVHSDQPVNYIYTPQSYIDAKILIQDSATWNMQTEFISQANFYANNLWTHGYSIKSPNAELHNCYLDTSTITCGILDGYYLHGDSASIVGIGDANLFYSSIKYIDLHIVRMVNSFSPNIQCYSIRVDTSTLPMVTIKSSSMVGNYLQFYSGLIQRCDIYDSRISTWFHSNFDTLRLLTPGQEMDIMGSVTINDKLEIISTGAFPTTILGASSQDSIIMTLDTVCLDFLYIKDVIATGGTVYYAGASSVDQGGNSGWLFTSCPIGTFINQLSNDYLMVYPNPATNNFYIEREGSGEIKVSLIRFDGSPVLELCSHERKFNLNTAGLAKGLYTIRIQSAHQNSSKNIVIN